MAARGRGGGKTPERVVELLKEAVSKSSQTAVAKMTGQTRLTIQRYLQGIGEPSQATLQKLADYFGVPVAYLRGEEKSDNKQLLDYLRKVPGILSLPTLLIGTLEKIRGKEIVTDVDREELSDAANIARWVLYAPKQSVDMLYATFDSRVFEILKALSKEITKKYDTMMKQCGPKEKKRLLALRKEFEKTRFDAARDNIRRIDCGSGVWEYSLDSTR